MEGEARVLPCLSLVDSLAAMDKNPSDNLLSESCLSLIEGKITIQDERQFHTVMAQDQPLLSQFRPR